MFQWGRFSDGHELVNQTGPTSGVGINGSTSTNATTDNPDHGLFIIEPGSPSHWQTTPNNNLWQGVSGLNNPCPEGFRLPTTTEMNTLVSAASITNNTIAASSSLAFSNTGTRSFSSAGVSPGNNGFYWTSSVNGSDASLRYFGGGVTAADNNRRTYGFGVRCIKD